MFSTLAPPRAALVRSSGCDCSIRRDSRRGNSRATSVRTRRFRGACTTRRTVVFGWSPFNNQQQKRFPPLFPGSQFLAIRSGVAAAANRQTAASSKKPTRLTNGFGLCAACSLAHTACRGLVKGRRPNQEWPDGPGRHFPGGFGSLPAGRRTRPGLHRSMENFSLATQPAKTAPIAAEFALQFQLTPSPRAILTRNVLPDVSAL